MEIWGYDSGWSMMVGWWLVRGLHYPSYIGDHTNPMEGSQTKTNQDSMEWERDFVSNAHWTSDFQDNLTKRGAWTVCVSSYPTLPDLSKAASLKKTSLAVTKKEPRYFLEREQLEIFDWDIKEMFQKTMLDYPTKTKIAQDTPTGVQPLQKWPLSPATAGVRRQQPFLQLQSRSPNPSPLSWVWLSARSRDWAEVGCSDVCWFTKPLNQWIHIYI